MGLCTLASVYGVSWRPRTHLRARRGSYGGSNALQLVLRTSPEIATSRNPFHPISSGGYIRWSAASIDGVNASELHAAYAGDVLWAASKSLDRSKFIDWIYVLLPRLSRSPPASDVASDPAYRMDLRLVSRSRPPAMLLAIPPSLTTVSLILAARRAMLSLIRTSYIDGVRPSVRQATYKWMGTRVFVRTHNLASQRKDRDTCCIPRLRGCEPMVARTSSMINLLSKPRIDMTRISAVPSWTVANENVPFPETRAHPDDGPPAHHVRHPGPSTSIPRAHPTAKRDARGASTARARAHGATDGAPPTRSRTGPAPRPAMPSMEHGSPAFSRASFSSQRATTGCLSVPASTVIFLRCDIPKP
ncbi:hypothetical protein C8R47DRAFT_1322635 [Mycena vitilis]|nr:hypothetical protein C8R47DRAFT_1322635 [Mycena vitilis]